MAEAFEEVAWVFNAALGQPLPVFGAEHTEELCPLRLEEIAHILGKDNGNARQIAQRGDHASSLQLRKKAGGKAGVAAQLNKSHAFALAEVLDAITDAFTFNELLGGFGGDAGVFGRFDAIHGS